MQLEIVIDESLPASRTDNMGSVPMPMLSIEEIKYESSIVIPRDNRALD